MEFEGTVYRIMPLTQGESARGPWQRQDVVFDYNDGGGNFTRKICVTFFNRPDDVAKLREGATYQVSVNIESREYNGRWYTDIRAWRLQPKQLTAKLAKEVKEMTIRANRANWDAIHAAEEKEEAAE